MRNIFFTLLFLLGYIINIPAQKPDSTLHVYILMGQSNMAGRGKITDKFKEQNNPRVLMLNKSRKWEVAKHPLHFDKPASAGVGPGLAFGLEMAKANPDIKIGLVPCAVGGTPIDLWQPGSFDKTTKTYPYDDALVRIKAAMKLGVVKGVLWHQGEGDQNSEKASVYISKLKKLVERIRHETKNPELPFVAGELGRYLKHGENINEELARLPSLVPYTAIASSEGLNHKGDGTHFNSVSANQLGERFAQKMKELQIAVTSKKSNSSFGNFQVSDSTKRRAELQRILKLLPPDATHRGHVSYLDKTFQDWLNRTGELPPDFDKLPSLPFLPNPLILDEGGQNIPIKTKAQWQEKREWMKNQLAHYISGTSPPKPDNLEYQILSEKKDGLVTLRTVELRFGPDQAARLTVELIIPPGDGPFPVFMTNWNHRDWALIAVRRGYIGCVYAGADDKDDTEAYSKIWAGEYDFTRLMRRAYGASRAIDYLYTLPSVDKDKIGITGHSRNGKTSLMAAAFDERIGACIPSSGGAGAEIPWRYCAHKYGVEDIALLTCAQPSWLHPRLRFFIGREHKLPVDQNHFMALIAPRGLMLSTAISEAGNNTWGAEQAFHASKKVYKFLGAEENIAIASRIGTHGVNARDIERYIDFFDHVFKRNTLKPENRLYTNYSFKEWQELSGEKFNINDFAVQKSDNLDKFAKDIITTGSLRNWKTKKAEIRKSIKWILGEEPAGATNFGPKSLKKGGIGERKFGFFQKRPKTTSRMEVMQVTPYDGFGENLFGYLYYPVNEKGSPITTNIPVVIFLHELDYSKGFSSLKYDHEIQSFFENLTDMGYAVFAYDMLGFGTRVKEATNFYKRYPNWSKMGKMVADARGAVDALSNMDIIDSKRIYTAGYSVGGMVGLLSTALDDRIAGVVSVAGFTPMRSNTLDRGTEGIKAYSHLHGLLPRLGFFVGEEKRIPVDFDEILASIAPRPALIVAPKYDKDAHLSDIKQCIEQAKSIYKIHNAESNIQLTIPDDYNRLSPAARADIYSWVKDRNNDLIQQNIDPETYLKKSVNQVSRALPLLKDRTKMPYFIGPGKVGWTSYNITSWVSGFWPGLLWYIYDFTGDEFWKKEAYDWTMQLKPIKHMKKKHHDIGFMMYSSFGNGLKHITDTDTSQKFKDILIETADSLSTLYNPNAGTILSWPYVKKKGWSHNTIIDNMMNLELLFWASKTTGNNKYRNIAISHAEKTSINQIRPDSSTYHVALYDSLSGNFLKGVTAQGAADHTMWARGQAWAIYGFTVAYRETNNPTFLETANKLALKYIRELPDDFVPYWDFNAPNIPNEEKDASATAITASALFELSGLITDRKLKSFYLEAANKMLKSLSENYFSDGSNVAILVHSVANKTRGKQVDVPIIYADYYYFEALLRMRQLNK